MQTVRRSRLLFGLAFILAGLAAACSGNKAPDQVHILTWEGDVNPVMARYVDRGLDEAEDSDARAVVLRLDTPGGLDSAMRDVVQRIEASRVPVIVYVSPAGGRAASAGAFITLAGHVAAMAPNTTIGAATPINASGDDIEGALGRKVMNDAVAYIRGIAELRGRNADWAESAVRDAVAINQNQAVELNVVDFAATSLEDLLAKANGRRVEVAGPGGATASVTLQTAGASVAFNNTGFFEELLDVIATPDIAFLLLSLGGLMIMIEILTPGFGVGIFGVVALALAFYSLGALPTNWTAVGLILFGFVLIAAEFHVSGFGALGIGGIIAVIFGGAILMGGSDPNLEVSRWVLAVFGVIGAFLVFVLAGALLRMRNMPSMTGRESLTGATGVARSRLDPRGVVFVRGERWDATAEDAPLEADAAIIVTATEGLRLIVKRDPASVKLLPVATETGAQRGEP